jgi:TatD DNase family protein
VIDTHCHLADAVYGDDLESTVARARAAGVEGVLCILSADEPDEITRAAAVRRAWPEALFATGIHPHRSGAYGDRLNEVSGLVAEAIDRTGAVALGEIGLDYHYDLAPRSVQLAVFRAQVALALERRLPIVIHTRKAEADTIAILREAGSSLRSVLHCFTGSVAEAREAVAAGAWISISGIATFPKAASIRDVAADVPADRLFVETDAPFLAPVPHRGKRNEPAWIRETYAAVATARGTTPEALAALVRANFSRFISPGEPLTSR